MDNNSLRMGYVMVSRALLLDIYGKRGAADGEEEAFLRVLTHVNYRDTTVLHGGVQVACGRGESVISFLGWSDILGWTRAHTRRFFEHCFAKGSIEKWWEICPVIFVCRATMLGREVREERNNRAKDLWTRPCRFLLPDTAK